MSEVIDEVVEEEVEEVTTMTKEEHQRESDRKVSKALATAKEKWEVEQSDIIQQKIEETERLATLSEKEKQEEIEKQRSKDIKERETALDRKILELDTVEALSDKGLPTSFKDYVIGTDAQDTQNRITKFGELWEKELSARRIDSMRGEIPGTGGTTALTKKDILDMEDPIKRKKEIAKNMKLFN